MKEVGANQGTRHRAPQSSPRVTEEVVGPLVTGLEGVGRSSCTLRSNSGLWAFSSFPWGLPMSPISLLTFTFLSGF